MHTCVLSHFSHVRLYAPPWTAVCWAPLSMGFSRQEYWSGLPFPPPGDLPYARIESASLTSPALTGGFFITSATWEAHPGSVQLWKDHSLVVRCDDGNSSTSPRGRGAGWELRGGRRGLVSGLPLPRDEQLQTLPSCSSPSQGLYDCPKCRNHAW